MANGQQARDLEVEIRYHQRQAVRYARALEMHKTQAKELEKLLKARRGKAAGGHPPRTR